MSSSDSSNLSKWIGKDHFWSRRSSDEPDGHHAATDIEEVLYPLFRSYKNKHFHLAEPEKYPNQGHKLLQHSTKAPLVSVVNMYVKPGEKSFSFWFIVSLYFPIISACLGPLANMISIVGLMEHWRIEISSQKLKPDSPGVIALNSLSLAFGIIGNFSLSVNFYDSGLYILTQAVSIFSWICASAVLTAGLLITNRDFIGPDASYRRSEGFWFAVFTAGGYTVSGLLLCINYLGYKCHKYPPIFNLNAKQRSLMTYTMCFAIWSVISTAIMRNLIHGLSYGSAQYYCMVSFLTIGLGDIVPKTASAKACILICSLIGVIILGLIVAMIRQVVLISAGPVIFWHHIEKERTKVEEEMNSANKVLTDRESFNKIRQLRKKASGQQKMVSLSTSVVSFLLLWLVGAMAFHYIEGWEYGNCVYFCFLCLITIGYGDFSPKASLGRAFFVVWAIFAVPLMTILISNIGDSLFNIFTSLTIYRYKLFSPTWYNKRIKDVHRMRKAMHEDSTEVSLEEIESELSLEENDANNLVDDIEETHNPNIEQDMAGYLTSSDSGNSSVKNLQSDLLILLASLKSLISDILDDPHKKYDHAVWSEYLQTIYNHDMAISSDETLKQITKKNFWLSKDSPLRLPLKEPNFIMLRILFRLEEDIRKLQEEERKNN